MKFITLEFVASRSECYMSIDGKRVETFTYDEGEIILSALKLLNAANAIDLDIQYRG